MPDLLFSKYDIHSVIQAQKKGAKDAVARAPEAFTRLPEEEVVARFADEFKVTVPTLIEENSFVTEKEVDVDISRDHRRMVWDRTSPFMIKGTEITVHVPYEGEMVFFDVRPSTYTLSPPRGEVKQEELLLKFTFPNDMPPPNLRAELDRTLGEIKSHLQSLQSSAASLLQELPGIIRAAWQERCKQFQHKTSVIEGLGLPFAKKDLVPPPVVIPAGMPKKRVLHSTPNTSWKVFISHASEDKTAIAKPLADALIAAGLSVWYDQYTMKVGDSLRRKIDEGLANSQFGIVILSRAFFGRHWPEQELNGLAAREVSGKKVILPVWHDVSRDEIAQASPMLADRIGVPSSIGLDKVVEELIRAMND